ncbi:MAG TPA: prepilin peptidase [Actinomycetota bacterium]|nr:prepilin peptidase [Actinomycetota bacterium]
MIRALCFAVAGLLIGSFLTVVEYRVPRKESVVGGRSMCPSCGSVIRARDNIPVVSWVLLRGRCRSCGARISAIYPLTELATAALFVGASLEFESVWVAALISAFLAVLLALSAIDIRHRVIPNRIVYPSAVVALVAVVVLDLTGQGLDWVDGLIGLVAYGGGLLVIALIAPRGMGMGDVKLAGLIGLVVGSVALSHVAVAAGAAILLGGLAGILLLALGRGRKTKVPFGPYLAAGAAIAVFWGAQIANAYLSLVTS